LTCPLQYRLGIVGRRAKHLPKTCSSPKQKGTDIPKRGVIPFGIPTSIDTIISTLEMNSEDEDDDDDDDHNAIFEASSH